MCFKEAIHKSIINLLSTIIAAFIIFFYCPLTQLETFFLLSGKFLYLLSFFLGLWLNVYQFYFIFKEWDICLIDFPYDFLSSLTFALICIIFWLALGLSALLSLVPRLEGYWFKDISFFFLSYALINTLISF